MCLHLHKHVRKVKKNLRTEYRSLAHDTTWVLLTLFAFLSYAFEIRLAILSNCGTYLTGISDGIVITLVVLAAAFYFKSSKGA